MDGVVFTLDENNEIIKEEEIDMEDSAFYWNKRDDAGNRYFVTTSKGRHSFKKKIKVLTNFQPENEKSVQHQDSS